MVSPPPGAVAALPPACGNHPRREALVRCGDCARALCDECYRFRVDGGYVGAALRGEVFGAWFHWPLVAD